jgi:rubrerythrin
MTDPDYNVVLLLQQALEDCYRYQCFAEDARQAGDDELVKLFDELAESDRKIAARVKKILAARLAA